MRTEKCKICEKEFKTKSVRIYCSKKCQKEAALGVIYPDPKKIYKHQLNKLSRSFITWRQD